MRGGSAAAFGYDTDGLLMSAGATMLTRFASTGLLQSSAVSGGATTFGYTGATVAVTLNGLRLLRVRTKR